MKRSRINYRKWGTVQRTTMVAIMVFTMLVTMFVPDVAIAAPADTTPPSVFSVSPEDLAEDQPLNVAVSIQYDEPIVAGTNLAGITITPDPGGVSATVSGDTVTIDHTDFANAIEYTVDIPDGAIDDTSANPNAAYSWSFTTVAAPDTTPPSVFSVSPEDLAEDQPLNVAVSIQYDEPIFEGPNFDDIIIYDAAGGYYPGVDATINGDTINFTHEIFGDLSTYTPRIAEGAVQDASGNLNARYEWSFTTGFFGVPFVTDKLPLDGDDDVAQNATVSAIFNEDVTEVDLSNVEIWYKIGDVPDLHSGVSATLDEATDTVTFTHDPFLVSTQYWVVIPTNSVQDGEGYPNVPETEWTFTTTDTGIDLTPPDVLSQSPANGTDGHALDVAVSVQYDEPIFEGPNFDDPESFVIYDEDHGYHPGVTATINGDTVTIDFTHDVFAEGSTYVPRIRAGAVQDASGNLNARYEWSFTTIETGPPGIDNTLPINGATDVSLDAVIEVTFNEDVTEVDLSGITIDNGATGISASFNPGHDRITITHDEFTQGTIYTVTIPSGTVQDTSGNPNELYSWNFTTVHLPVLNFSGRPYTVPEAGPAATITVVLSETSLDTVTVDYATSDGTAQSGLDYNSATGTLTFAPGETMQTFTVPVIDDTIIEANETVILTLSNPTSAVIGQSNPTSLLIINDDLPSVYFDNNSYSIPENGGSITIGVVVSPTSPGTVTVNYSTSDNSATAGSDYTAANGTLTFAPFDVAESFDIFITDDIDFETLTETLTISLSDPSGATLGTPDSVILSIHDDDQNIIDPVVSTNVATDIGLTSAVLHGNLIDIGSASNVDVFFEWGTTLALENEIFVDTTGTPEDFAILMTGLSAGHTYFFRAKAVGDSTVLGVTRMFTTDAPYAPPAAVAGGGGAYYGGAVPTPPKPTPTTTPSPKPTPPAPTPTPIPTPPAPTPTPPEPTLSPEPTQEPPAPTQEPPASTQEPPVATEQPPAAIEDIDEDDPMPFALVAGLVVVIVVLIGLALRIGYLFMNRRHFVT